MRALRREWKDSSLDCFTCWADVVGLGWADERLGVCARLRRDGVDFWGCGLGGVGRRAPGRGAAPPGFRGRGRCPAGVRLPPDAWSVGALLIVIPWESPYGAQLGRAARARMQSSTAAFGAGQAGDACHRARRAVWAAGREQPHERDAGTEPRPQPFANQAHEWAHGGRKASLCVEGAHRLNHGMVVRREPDSGVGGELLRQRRRPLGSVGQMPVRIQFWHRRTHDHVTLEPVSSTKATNFA